MKKRVVRKIETVYYHNNQRLHPTKNKYTMMLNKEYVRRKAIDQKDKKLQND